MWWPFRSSLPRRSSTPPTTQYKPLGKPVLSDQDMVAAALLWPGFGPHSEVWRLTIRLDGLLSQEIEIANYDNSSGYELRHEWVQLPTEELDAIVAIADGIGFRDFQDRYEDHVTDQEILWIAVRFGDTFKTVQADGSINFGGRDDNREMLGFLELWGRIHRFAAYPTPYNRPEVLIAGTKRFYARLQQELGGTFSSAPSGSSQGPK